jgi:hypothetical protein
MSTVRISMWSAPSPTVDYQPLFQKLWHDHVVAEVERRALGVPPTEYVTQAHIAHKNDGRVTVRLNEESQANFAFRYQGPSTTADAIRRLDPQWIDDVSVVNVSDDDPIAAHDVLIRGSRGWWLAYDFRSQRKQIARHGNNAGQFLYAARAAIEASALHAFASALYDGAEQIAYATLLLTPHPDILKLRKHQDTVTQFTCWTELGNADPAFSQVLTKFEGLRNTARFRPQKLSLTEAEGRDALDVVERACAGLAAPAVAVGPFPTPTTA